MWPKIFLKITNDLMKEGLMRMERLNAKSIDEGMNDSLHQGESCFFITDKQKETKNMESVSENVQLYRDPLEALEDACYKYRISTFGMIEPNDDKRKEFLSSEAEYKKAIKSAIKYLRGELKSVEESCWSSLAIVEKE